MLSHDNYIMHFNKNHDPRNGQFTKGSGGSSSSNSNGSIKTNKKKMNPTLKKVLIGAGIATGVAAAAAGTYFISKHFNQKNSITKTVDNLKKIKFTKKSAGSSFLDFQDSKYHVDDNFMNKQGEAFIKGINKNKKINKYKLTGYKEINGVGRSLIDGKFETLFMGTQITKDGNLNLYSMMSGDSLYMKNGIIKDTTNRSIYSHDVKKIGNAILKTMLVKRAS